MTWDLDRLTEFVTDAVISQLGARHGLGEPPCACHHLGNGHCPDVMRPLVERGAERFGLTASAPHRRAIRAHRSYALETRRDRRPDSNPLLRGSRVQVRDGVHPAHVGALRRPPASRNRRRCVHRHRVPARREHSRRQSLRGPPHYFRRCNGSRHGHQYRRSQIARLPNGGRRYPQRGSRLS